MIQILLIDDDAFFRTNLINYLNWDTLSCEIAGQAVDGQQAISLLQAQDFDVVITDMDMPVLNGVEVIRHIRQFHPHIPCLVLSGFDDFGFVKESLKLGAVDYVLKHTMTKESFEATIRNLVSGIDENANGRLKTQTLQKSVRDEIIKNILHEEIAITSKESIKEVLNECAITLPNIPFVILLIRLENLHELKTRIGSEERFAQTKNMAVGVVQGLLDSFGSSYCFEGRNDVIYGFLNSKSFLSTLYFLCTTNMIIKGIKENLVRFLNIRCAVSHSDLCLDINNIVYYFKSTLGNLSQMSGGDMLLDNISASTVATISIETEQLLLTEFFAPEFEKIQGVIEAEFQKHQYCNASKQALQHLSIEFINLLRRICQNKKIFFDSFFVFSNSPYTAIVNMHSLSELTAYIVSIYKTVWEQESNFDSCENTIVRDALSYIRGHYFENLSLSAVAHKVHCNATYLSRVFKESTGLGFVQYLTDFRIEKAAQLLQFGHPIKEVAQKVGFENYNYFFTVFKKKMGCSPQEYAKNNI